MITLTSNTIIEILGCRVLCWAGFSSAEWFGTEFRQFSFIFFPRNEIPSCFLFRWRIRKGILRVFFYFCIHRKEFRVVFSSAEVIGRKFREFASFFVQWNGIPSCFLFRGRVRNGIPRLSVPRNSRNSVGNNHLFRLFRLPRNYFLSEIPNPKLYFYRGLRIASIITTFLP